MRILSHPFIKDLFVDENNFAATARLEGEYSLLELQQVQRGKLIELAGEDIRSGAYKVVTVTPELVNQNNIVEEKESVWLDAVVNAAGEKRMVRYVDNRTAPSYTGFAWHDHENMGDVVSALCIESGLMPSIFVRDTKQLMEILINEMRQVEGIRSITSLKKLEEIVHALYKVWTESHTSREEIREMLTISKDRLVAKKEILPRLGNINIFGAKQIHAGGELQNPEDVPGELSVEFSSLV
jgi:hypothetical protein